MCNEKESCSEETKEPEKNKEVEPETTEQEKPEELDDQDEIKCHHFFNQATPTH